VRSSWV